MLGSSILLLLLLSLTVLYKEVNSTPLYTPNQSFPLKPYSTFFLNITLYQSDDAMLQTITSLVFVPNEYFTLYTTEIQFSSVQPYRKWRCSGASNSISVPITVPPAEGLHTFTWRVKHTNTSYDHDVSAQYEVTCSDGVKCNGVERFIEGKCVSAGAPLCEDFDDCTIDHCDETNGRCSYTLVDTDPACVSCKPTKCRASCSGKVCGNDGCGGSCGLCTGNLSCNSGQCTDFVFPGTCNTAYLITSELAAINFSGQIVKNGDTSVGANILFPLCNIQSTATEQIYKFVNTFSGFIGIDARVTSATGNVDALDTVLQLIEVNPAVYPNPDDGCLASNGNTILCVSCADDSSPPGGLASRITWSLKPNYTYYVHVDGYSTAQVGPYVLTMIFTPGCTLNCAGKYCGNSGCNNVSCGDCGVGFVCGSSATCVPFPCKPDCSKGKQCGSDGCGGSCGSCKGGYVCYGDTQKCKQVKPCDHFIPVCMNGQAGRIGCPAGQWCGSDCACHKLNEPLMDLIIVREDISPVIVYNYQVGAASCAIAEGCIAAPGSRTIVKFSTNVGNQGDAAFAPPYPPANYPQLYVYGACHGHWHFSGFAQFKLIDGANNVLVIGRKQSYCAEDSYQFLNGTQVNCDATTNCGTQGLSRGWVDVYGPDLDCQFLDITGVAPGNYQIQLCTNQLRSFEERSRENNCATVPFTIPVPPSSI